jgi:phosphopantetheinyl transferase
MVKQMSWLDDHWKQQYETHIQELIMTTSIARQRVTIAHLDRELLKEKARFERLRQPKLKSQSGTRITMLRERLNTNQNILRELLIEKGYLHGTDDIPF